MIQILGKRKKANPIIIGAPGVGKTSVVEGLAIKIANGDVDHSLKNKRIVEINMSSIVSGTKYRGEFEQRMEEMIREIEESPEIIIFFDEIHNLVGAGGASGTLDASNIIKPALSKGNMKCIGATTLDEYKKYIEGHGAFERRFQKVYIDEPSVESTLRILNRIKHKYENHHGVSYSEEVIKACVEMADRYITYRKFPDKAIDILDEAGSKTGIINARPVGSIKIFEDKIRVLSISKDEAVKKLKYEEAAKLRDEEKRIHLELEAELRKWEEDKKRNKVEVTIETIASIISSHTGIPVNKISDSENKKLLDLAATLKAKVIGQDEAIDKIVEAIQRSRIGIQDPRRPLAVFLCLGSTGVGKCVIGDTVVTIRNKITGKVESISIFDFINKTS